MPNKQWLRREVEQWHSQLSVTNPMDRRIAEIMYAWRKQQYLDRNNYWSRTKHRAYMRTITDISERDIADNNRKWKTFCEKQDHTRG